ncbi:hypothetical protein K469DRAFT_698058 [Zopfia rhizophila CBS 207.26]|uniref:Alpha/beta hydrolase fold-3 domain-containing protein n=1 Tax=Zopfia rhizophila CBS 207.26 TaxID=1314779 RepID=A0A6A6EIE1_9PEZI|nr:hypothetical protein K469DRAFT_698058 [Zopfia rhizophila CBS 207.26]
MDPAGNNLYTDVMTYDDKTKPEKFGATWYPKPPEPSQLDAKNIALHFHGGGYKLDDGRIADCGFPAILVLDNTPARYALCPQYPLSFNPGCRFPAAFQAH